MREKFRKIKLSKSNKQRLDIINSIIREYQKQGYTLTLRQLYYQLVSRDVIPNKVSEYAKLSTLLKEGRMAGVVDWDAIEDRLRVPYSPSQWDSPEEIMEVVAKQYRKDRMFGQDIYLEVWVEKDALSGVLKRVTSVYGIPILVNRGYSSVSAVHDAYERFRMALSNNQKVEILYLGDFDPSGIDMIRDVYDRPLEMLCSQAKALYGKYCNWVEKEYENDFDEAQDYLTNKYQDVREYPNCFCLEDEDDKDSLEFDYVRAWIHEMFKVTPIALTRDQIRKYNPPPNPAKKTDPRSKKFISEHGGSSWEIDALRPEVLNQILTDVIVDKIDMDKYEDVLLKEKKDRVKLDKAKTLLVDIKVNDDEIDNSKEEEEDYE